MNFQDLRIYNLNNIACLFSPEIKNVVLLSDPDSK